jgi:hypothetical protein
MIFYSLRYWQRRSGRRQPLIAFLFLAILPCSVLAAVSQGFFPSGLFYPDNPKLDAFVVKWYSEQLTALEEPSLFEAKQDPTLQSYRFLWLRTFHRPVAVRVLIHPDGSGKVITKMADGSGGYKPGKLLVDKAETLPPDRMKKLLEKVEQLSYWTLPARDPKPPGFDGARWIVEGVDHGKYHLVDRWSPTKGPVRELGLYFLRDSARLSLKDEEIY